MKKLLWILTCLSGIANAQVVAIPDASFKAVLLYKYDFNHDNQVQNAEVDTVQTLSISSLSIGSLTGLQAFTSLKNLYCSSNQLTAIDLSQNTQLQKLTCSYNPISHLDLSMNPSLAYFDAVEIISAVLIFLQTRRS